MYRNTLTCWSTTMPSTSTMMHQSRVLNNRSQRRYFSVSLSLMSSSSSTSRRVAQQYGRHHKNDFFRNNRRSSNRVLLAEAARERGKPVFLRNIIPKPPSLTSSSPRSRITSSVASFVFTLSSIGIACGIGSRRNEGSGEGGGGLFWTMLPSSLLSISTTGCESAFIVLHDDDENENATMDSTSSNSKTTTTTNKTTTYPNGEIDKIVAASSVWFGIQRVLRMIRRVMKLTLVFSPVVTLYPVHWITWHLWRKITNNGNDDANYSSSTNDAHEIVMHSVSSMDGNTIANNWWYYRLSLWCVEWSGAACIKIMQWAGSRPDMFGPNFCAIFCKLQDRVTPHAWKYTKVAMTQAYGVDWEQKIELHPNDLVGCGCIAQVYKAHATIIGDDDDDKSTNMNDSAVVDNSGNNNNENSNSNPNNTNNSDTINHGTSMKTKKKAMAVKVMHPNVERDIAADLDIMRLIVRLLEASHVTKDLKWLNLGGIVEEMAVMLQTQLDLRTEGANLVRFNQNFSKDKNNDTKILFPQIVPEYPPTKRVLMETYMDGQPVMEFIRTNKSDPKLLTTMCTEAIQAVCQMIFLDNFTHGDLHPGNVMVTNDHKFVLLDVGITTVHSESDHRLISDILASFIRCDGRKAGRLMIDDSNKRMEALGGDDRSIDEEQFIAEMEQLTIQAQGENYFMEHLGVYISHICQCAQTHHVMINQSFISAALAVKVQEGVALALDPSIEIWKIAIPIVLEGERKHGRAVERIQELFGVQSIVSWLTAGNNYKKEEEDACK